MGFRSNCCCLNPLLDSFYSMKTGFLRRIATLLLVLGGILPASAFASPSLNTEMWGLRVLEGFFPQIRGELRKQQDSALWKDRYYAGNSAWRGPRGERNELHVIVISDLNGSYGSLDYRQDVHRAVEEIIARRPDVVLSTGDMVAGQREGLDYRGMWQGFHEAVTIPLKEAGIPFLITPGNHDGAGTPRFAHERAIFVDEWEIHRPKVTFVDDTHYPTRYSAVVGPVFFISLDSTTVGPLSRDQMRWLEVQLKRAANYPVKIVFGHVPLYAVAYNKQREIIGDPALEALFNKHGVQAYISGHHHAYYPGARGSLRLVSMPCLGSGLRRLIATNQGYSPRGFVEFVAAEGGLYDLDSWKGPDFKEVVSRDELPAKIGLAKGPLVRDDLLGLDLRSRPLMIDTTVPRGTVAEGREGGVRRGPALPADLFE